MWTISREEHRSNQVIRESAPGSADAVESHLPISELAPVLGPFMPMYHVVSDGEEVAHTRHLYPHRSARQFEADLDLLLQAFSPISLDTLVEYLDGGVPLPRRAMFLSFDDGLRQQLEIVAPILRRKGVPATAWCRSAADASQPGESVRRVSDELDLLAIAVVRGDPVTLLHREECPDSL